MVDPGFNLRWQEHPKPQATTESMFWSKTGWTPADLKGQRVLDAGCGIGRFSALAVAAGAVVTGIDAAPAAIAGAKANVPGAEFFPCDLLDVDAYRFCGPFDKVFSLGVLHHTADPGKAFRNVASLVRPGGQLAVWLYGAPTDDPVTLAAMEFLHAITRACPPEALHAACQEYATRLRDLYGDKWGPLQQVLQASTSRDAEECVSDTFDWHCPQYRSLHTVPEVRGWFEAAGFEVDRVGNFPVSLRGTKR